MKKLKVDLLRSEQRTNTSWSVVGYLLDRTYIRIRKYNNEKTYRLFCYMDDHHGKRLFAIASNGQTARRVALYHLENCFRATNEKTGQKMIAGRAFTRKTKGDCQVCGNKAIDNCECGWSESFIHCVNCCKYNE